MKKQKRGAAKRFYLLREIREMWDQLAPLGVLKVNKVRAHCLDAHNADYSFEQVKQQLYNFKIEIDRSYGGTNEYAAIPDGVGGAMQGLIKADDSPEGRAIVEAYRRRAMAGTVGRLRTQQGYLCADVHKKILTKRQTHNILMDFGIGPDRMLPAHAE